MLLGLHTYSFHLQGMGQNWGGYKLQWAPLSFTNHFSDHRIVFDQYGCRITGVATGSGDVPMREAYQIIKANPNIKRINIEVEFDPGTDGREEARRREYQAVVDSIRFTRVELGVGG